MFVKAFGFLDMIAAVLLIFELTGGLHWRAMVAIALYLIIKGFAFWGDFFSMVDLGVGIYVVFAAVTSVTALTIIASLWLFLKGFYSLVS